MESIRDNFEQDTSGHEDLLDLFPSEHNKYNLHELIGSTKWTKVYRATCQQQSHSSSSSSSELVIKIVHLYKGSILDVGTAFSHSNILKPLTCLNSSQNDQWVVMPFLSNGSLRSIVSSHFAEGMDEVCLAIVLREVLLALVYLHGPESGNQVHGSIKPSNIFLDSVQGSIKLADIGFSDSFYNPYQMKSYLLEDIPYWIAPELKQSNNDFNSNTDIWLLGITALELAYGRPPVSQFLPSCTSLFNRIGSPLFVSDYRKGEAKKFSKNFKDMVLGCLDEDPLQRPTAEMLLKHCFFENCKNLDFLVKVINENKYSSPCKRRITRWNLDEDSLEFRPGSAQGTRNLIDPELN